MERAASLGIEDLATAEFVGDLFRGPAWQAGGERCVNPNNGLVRFKIHSGEYWREFFTSDLPDEDDLPDEGVVSESRCGLFVALGQATAGFRKRRACRVSNSDESWDTDRECRDRSGVLKSGGGENRQQLWWHRRPPRWSA